MEVFVGDGAGGFTSTGVYPIGAIGARPRRLAFADSNGDSLNDVIAANQSGNTIGVLHGNGDGTFDAFVSIEDVSPLWVVAEDVNRDGVADLVISRANGTLAVRLATGGTYGPATVYAVGVRGPVVVSDLNADGNPDFVAGSQSGGPDLTVFFGAGDGTFTPGGTYRVANGGGLSLVSADLDDDGDRDLIVGGSARNEFSILMNDGAGIFGGAQSFPVPYFFRSLAIGRVDGDSRLDIVSISGFSSSYSVHLQGVCMP